MWLNTPDELVGWLPLAVIRGWRLGRSGDQNVILASGPPFTAVLIGALLRRSTGLPLIADFRDAWVNDHTDPFRVIGGSFRAPYGKSRIRVLERLERFCIGEADLVLFTSDFTRDRYCEAYPILRDRSIVIMNGTEEDDFRCPPRDLGAFTFSYIGSLHEFQLWQVGLFLEAMQIASRRSLLVERTRLLIGGHRGAQADAWLNSELARRGLSERTTLRHDISHDETAAILKGSGAILLLVGDNPYVRLTKVSDAAAAQRPILALAPHDSETAKHVRTLGETVYSGRSPEELAAYLERLAQPVRSSPPADFPFRYPHPLNWRTATRCLAEHLDSLIIER
jgi:glycosyltransferase involved in cell wall biosynthesis